jgi:hypothetical protein
LGFSIILFPIDQPCLKKGEPDPEVPLFKGDLGGFLGVKVTKKTFQTPSKGRAGAMH